MNMTRILSILTCCAALNLCAGAATPGDIAKKAQATIIPKFDLKGVTPEVALQTISRAAGIPIHVTLAKGEQPSITLTLQQIPASEALTYVTELAGLKVKYEKDSILVAPTFDGPEGAKAPAAPICTRVTKVNGATFVQNLRRLLPPNPGEADDQLLARYFKTNHVEAQAIQLDKTQNTLLMRATSAEQKEAEALIEQIIAGRSSKPGVR